MSKSAVNISSVFKAEEQSWFFAGCYS